MWNWKNLFEYKEKRKGGGIEAHKLPLLHVIIVNHIVSAEGKGERKNTRFKKKMAREQKSLRDYTKHVD